MPAFGEALSEEELEGIVTYVRDFCRERTWPRGDLNFPRLLVTEKAFPEDEVVMSLGVTRRNTSITNQFFYERRIGARSQMELAVPIVANSSGQGWRAGLGDVAVSVKQVLFHSLPRGQILSAGAEISLPTGKESRQLGEGVTIIEPFIAYGQSLPSEAFIQVQGGTEQPVDRVRADAEMFWRAAGGRTFLHGRFGRSWTPMLEVLGARELTPHASNRWDVVPQLQVSLSKRQHVVMNAGVRIPVTERSEHSVEFLAYMLWDWFEGGLWEGWR